MGRRTRFRLWLADAVFVIAAPIIAALVADPDVTALLAFLAGMALLGMLALLATTPLDAIRLKTSSSEWVVTGGMFVLFYLWPIACNRSFGQAWHIEHVGIALIVLGGLFVCRNAFETRQRDTPRTSVWWAAPMMWNPLLGVLAARGLSWEVFLALPGALLLLGLVERLLQRKWSKGLHIGALRWSLAIAAFGASAIYAGVLARGAP